jgi:hypothetical protein
VGHRHLLSDGSLVVSHSLSKAALGFGFLSIVETGRFGDWADEELPLSDSWWFFQ